ncbi:MAG: bifunctional tRNA pseudouridine(32) synthase/23S rRNA pseudouridine(746) synthase RluA [Candidatus Pelagadaptatus aseana]|uniref:RluA family pseudouridine synthase n=1 Tax=Candidatus Pelagadaptatus aseana TaxID=3120508 RepID=UPI0039B363DE
MNHQALHILYADEDLLAINKPAGLLTVPGRGIDNQDCLINRALDAYPNSRVVHRLDMATSGIVLLPQNHQSLSALSKQFQARTVKKRYCALVYGCMDADNGSVDLPLVCDWPNRPRQMVCHTNGKPSQTNYEVVERENGFSRVLLYPITGRSHQLRVHMQALGHPILGDFFYAHERALTPYSRLMLHAEYIAFKHPRTGESITLECPPAF